jgi:hypothetical protein
MTELRGSVVMRRKASVANASSGVVPAAIIGGVVASWCGPWRSRRIYNQPGVACGAEPDGDGP